MASDFELNIGVKEYKLDNGLTILIKENHAAPVFTAQLWFKVGACDEPEGLSGAAHLIEHMLFRSTRNFKAGEITQSLRAMGGIDNAATSSDYTYYWVLMNPVNLDFAIEIMSERFYANFDVDELERERTVVISEMQGYENNPIQQLYKSLYSTAYTVNTYKRPIIGYKQDLLSMTRCGIYDFYKKHYIPGNATLVVTGDINESDVIKLVDKYFGCIECGQLPLRPYMEEPPQNGKRICEIDTLGDSAIILMGYHIPDIYNKDMDTLDIISHILSSGKSSRLYQSMVETGKALEVWGDPCSRRFPCLFVFAAIGQSDTTESELEAAIKMQIDDLKRNPITAAEFIKALNQAKADIIFENASVSGQGQNLGASAVFGDWRDYDLIISRLEDVTAEDIMIVANKYFIDSNLTVARSNKTDKLNIAEILAPDFKKREYLDIQSDISNNIVENKEIKPERRLLSNGTVVLIQENHTNPTVAIDGYLLAGSVFEPNDMPGVAFLVSNMLTRGTKTKSSLEIAHTLENLGASLEFFKTTEKLGFAGRAISKDIDTLLTVFADVLINPSFPEEELEKIKQESMAEIIYSKQIPGQVAYRAFYNRAVPLGDPNYQPSFDDTQRFLENVRRDDLLKFYKEYYRPDTLVISVCGDITADDAIRILEDNLSDFKAPRTDKPIIPNTEYCIPEKLEKIEIKMPDKSESSVVYGYPINMSRRHPDFYKMRIANHILGGGGAINSRLGIEIRENRGLVYGIGSQITGMAVNGMWLASFGTAPEKVNEAVDTMYAIMADFKEKGITETELEDTKRFIIGMFSQSLETNEGCAAILSQIEFSSLGLDFLHRIGDYYNAVTLEDIKEICEKYFYPEKGTMVIVGP